MVNVFFFFFFAYDMFQLDKEQNMIKKIKQFLLVKMVFKKNEKRKKDCGLVVVCSYKR